MAGLVADLGRVIDAGLAMFQSPTLMPWSRVAGNVRLPSTSRTCRGDRRRRGATRLRSSVWLTRANGTRASCRAACRCARPSRARACRVAVDPAHGRTLRRARRVHAAPARRRPRRAVGPRAGSPSCSSPTASRKPYLATRIVVMSARPGCIAADLAIDAAAPAIHDYRGSAAFAAGAPASHGRSSRRDPRPSPCGSWRRSWWRSCCSPRKRWPSSSTTCRRTSCCLAAHRATMIEDRALALSSLAVTAQIAHRCSPSRSSPVSPSRSCSRKAASSEASPPTRSCCR